MEEVPGQGEDEAVFPTSVVFLELHESLCSSIKRRAWTSAASLTEAAKLLWGQRLEPGTSLAAPLCQMNLRQV